MANILTPLRRRFSSDESQTPVTSEVLGSAADGDVILERQRAVGPGPIGDIGMGGALVVANSGDDSVSIVDPATLEVLDTVALGGEPIHVVVADDRAYVSVASAAQDAVAVIDLDAGVVTATFPVASGITALAASPDGKRVYAGRYCGERVELTVIDVTAERLGTIDIGAAPAANIDALLVAPDGKRLHVAVTDANGSQLIVVDAETTRVQRVIAVGSPIRDIATAGGVLYVLTSDRAVGGAVLAIDLSTGEVTDSVIVGGAPTRLSVSPEDARAYVVDYDRVVVLGTLSLDIVDALSVAARPSCVTPRDSRVFIADYSGAVSTFSVDSAIEKLYSQFLATDAIALRAPRALQQAGV